MMLWRYVHEGSGYDTSVRECETRHGVASCQARPRHRTKTGRSTTTGYNGFAQSIRTGRARLSGESTSKMRDIHKVVDKDMWGGA
jgi:hypothetical protein